MGARCLASEPFSLLLCPAAQGRGPALGQLGQPVPGIPGGERLGWQGQLCGTSTDAVIAHWPKWCINCDSGASCSQRALVATPWRCLSSLSAEHHTHTQLEGVLQVPAGFCFVLAHLPDDQPASSGLLSVPACPCHRLNGRWACCSRRLSLPGGEECNAVQGECGLWGARSEE